LPDDIAFLVADLEAQGVPRLAHAFLQAWLESCGDWQACRLLPLYQAHRALVRAKVAALSSSADAAATTAPRRAHARYLAHAAGVLRPQRPAVLLMCGLSGSGKTWLATRLASELAAVHLRSDIERKRAAGLAPLAASDSGVGRALYAPEATAALYRRLLAHTADIIAGGRGVVVDATFLRAAERHAWREQAAAAGSPFRVIHCSAPPDAAPAHHPAPRWPAMPRKPICRCWRGSGDSSSPSPRRSAQRSSRPTLARGRAPTSCCALCRSGGVRLTAPSPTPLPR
jgi:hypothetical protein